MLNHLGDGKKCTKYNNKNMTFEQEEELLKKYEDKAKKGTIIKGTIITVEEIKREYEEKVGHKIGSGQIYKVLKRHKWRKIIQRSKHPKKASEEVIEYSKKFWCNKNIRPSVPCHHIREYSYAYGAVEPLK